MKQEIEVFEKKPGRSLVVRIEYWQDWKDEAFTNLLDAVRATFPQHEVCVRKENPYTG